MQKHFSSLSLLILFCLFLGAGCASKTNLAEKYPLSEIDRPYTLPYSVDSWNIWLIPVENSVLPHPLIWEMSLSDDFSVVWVPLPLGIKWQIHREEKHRLGASAMYLLLGGTADVDYRYRLAQDWALNLNYNVSEFDTLILKIHLSTFSAGPLYQFTQKFAGKISFSKFSGYVSAGILTNAILSSFGSVTSNSRTYFDGEGANLDLYYSFNHQWNLNLGISMMNIDSVGSSASGKLALSHLW